MALQRQTNEKLKFFLMHPLLLGAWRIRKENTPQAMRPLISLGPMMLQGSGAGITIPILQTRKLRSREIKYLVKVTQQVTQC